MVFYALVSMVDITSCVVSPDQELYWDKILDEMKDFLYRKNYI